MSQQQETIATPLKRQRLTQTGMRRRDAGFGILMVIPAVFILVVVLGWPVLRLFYLSAHFFQLTSPERGIPFIGLENYLYAMQDPEMWASFGRTFVFTFSTLFPITSVTNCASLTIDIG